MTVFLTPVLFVLLSTLLLAALWRLFTDRRITLTLVVGLVLNTVLAGAAWLSPTLVEAITQYRTSSALVGYLAWTLAILWVALNTNLRSVIFIWSFWAVWVVAGAAIVTESTGVSFTDWFSETISVVFAFVTLYAFERVIGSDKLAPDERVLVISMGSLVCLDIFYLSLSIADLQAALWISQARPLLYLAVCVGLLVWALYRLQRRRQAGRLKLSYQAAQGGWSLLTMALVVSVMITSTTLIHANNSTAVNVLLTLSIVGLLLVVFIGAVSAKARRKMRVMVNKHFFSHRFDYRTEWMKVSEALASGSDQSKAEDVALSVLVNATASQSGVLWLKFGREFRVVASTAAAPNGGHSWAVDDLHPMVQTMLSHQWIFAVRSPLDSAAGQFNHQLPQWLDQLTGVWLVLPISIRGQVIGFAGLVSEQAAPEFDYESLDIARLSSDQVAGYLQLHRYEREQEAQARFAVYSQMSSFLMHDLNNVLHQQTLLLNNAPKHRDNPAFMDDVLDTIDNSVKRLRTLVGRLGTSKPEHRQPINLERIVDTAVTLYANTSGPPTLNLAAQLPDIACDHDKLAMAIGHIVKNAQDASAGGPVRLCADIQQHYARVRIQDSGPGMSEDFINHQLFKPFESTKQSGGLGIGVYLTKTYIEQLGGMIQVESRPNQGTLFSLFLPIYSGVPDATS